MMDFVIEGHRVSFERSAGAEEFRILVDGTAVPMTLTETKTRLQHRGLAGPLREHGIRR